MPMTTAVRRSPDSPPAFGTPMTDEEWVEMDEEHEGELVDGVLVEEELVNYPHEVVVAWLCQVVGNWLDAHGGGVVGSSGAKFVLRKGLGRKPDVSVYFAGSTKPPLEGGIRVPPDILVEILSKRPRDVRRDRIEKMHEYARFGVRFYWLLDPHARSFEVFARDDRGRYVREVGAAEGKVADVPGCEGLVLDLDALWRKLDALGETSE